MCECDFLWNINADERHQQYSQAASMQIAWIYIELVCLSLMLILQGFSPIVIVKQLGPTIVSTQYGDLRGVLVEFPSDSHLPLSPVEAYLGIQYGSIHAGNLRLIRSSSPNERWKGIRTARDYKPVCPQPVITHKQLSKHLPEGTVQWLSRAATFIREQTEDCLYLNLYVPIRGEHNKPTENIFIIIICLFFHSNNV